MIWWRTGAYFVITLPLALLLASGATMNFSFGDSCGQMLREPQHWFTETGSVVWACMNNGVAQGAATAVVSGLGGSAAAAMATEWLTGSLAKAAASGAARTMGGGLGNAAAGTEGPDAAGSATEGGTESDTEGAAGRGEGVRRRREEREAGAGDGVRTGVAAHPHDGAGDTGADAGGVAAHPHAGTGDTGADAGGVAPGEHDGAVTQAGGTTSGEHPATPGEHPVAAGRLSLPGVPTACLPLLHEFLQAEARAAALGGLAAAALAREAGALEGWHRDIGRLGGKLGLEVGELLAGAAAVLPEPGAAAAGGGTLPPAEELDKLAAARARFDTARDRHSQLQQELDALDPATPPAERQNRLESLAAAAAAVENARAALRDLEGELLGGAAAPVAIELATGLSQRLRGLLTRTGRSVEKVPGGEKGLFETAELLLNLRLNVLSEQRRAGQIQEQAHQAQREADAVKAQLDECVLRHMAG